MPACDKHFNNPKITERRWANARARRKKSAEELAELKCCACGAKPVRSFMDAYYAPDLATPNNITPHGLHYVAIAACLTDGYQTGSNT